MCAYIARRQNVFPQIFCGATTREEEKRRRQTLEYIFRRVSLIKRVLYLSLFHSLFVNACFITNLYVKCHVRIANRLVEDSYCRGGIVNTRGVCSRARSVRPNSPKALWRFRASTSNSQSSRTWPPTHTPIRQIDHTYAQQDIRVCEDDPFEPPIRQFSNPKALWLLRVSI